MVLASVCLSTPVFPVYAQLLAQVVVPSPTSSPGPSPKPTTLPAGIALPSATPSPHAYAKARGGPIRFSVQGSLTLGRSQTTQTATSGIFPNPSPTASGTPSPFIGAALTTTQSQSENGLGMFTELTRRTASTSTDIRIPLSFASGGSGGGIVGQSTIMYATPKYALGYGAQPTTAFGQLPLGGTLRSYYSIVPTSGGDLTFYEGPAIAAQGEQIPIEGLRWRDSNGDNIYEGGFVNATGPLTGDSKTFILGDALSLGPLTAIGEGAYQTRTGGDADASGFSYQLRADDGSTSTYLTAIVRQVSDNFVAFGSGEIYGDDYYSLAYHRGNMLQNFTLSASSERTGDNTGGELDNRLGNLSYSGPLRFGGYTLALNAQQTGQPGLLQSLVQSTFQLSANVGHGSLILGNVLSRMTSQSAEGGDESQDGYNAALSWPFHDLDASVSATSLRLTSQLSGQSLNTSMGFSLGRTFGRTGVNIDETLEHQISDETNAITSNLQFELSRQLSPAVTVQVQYGLQSLTDKLNPAQNGRSRNFAIQLNAPFSFGNGIVSGKVDPKLPATIVGRVVMATTTSSTFSGLSSSGLANVLIVLDDKTIQRTDVNGNFQFAFVTPGQHQLRVDSSSLPRGVTVDIPVNTIQVQGGQTAQVSFLVGSFGGISGHVYGRNDTGAIVPLPNVLLRVDGGTYSQTDSSGAYGFGKLQPGKHTVSVVENSVPAFATFDSANDKQTVNVQNGQYTVVDFTALPLGSIAGSILFGKDMDKEAGEVVPNAYVVAEPGEHAAIVNDDGSFVIDDLPPGDYTVSVDPETIPEGLGVEPDSIAVTLQSQEHYEGAAFTVGHTEKKVTFSFVGGNVGSSEVTVPKTHLSEPRLPLRGYTGVTVDAPQSAGSVTLKVFGSTDTLVYDAKAERWAGSITVPTNAKAGSYDIAPVVANGTQPEPARLIVDPKMPVALLQTIERNAQVGTYVRVRARFLVDARAGDRIDWADGQVTTLGKPVAGRVFTFSLRLTLRPLHGILLTRGVKLPISLM